MPEVLAPCCLHLHTLAQIALMRLVSHGVMMQKSTNREELQKNQARNVVSKS